MTDNVKITYLEVENVKRVRAVELDTDRPLTVIGGRNAQGKTSILDAIMWTLGGDRYRPSQPMRDGAEKLATRVVLSNGITVERTGKNGSLKVTDPNGIKGGQQLINSFVSQFALDLPKFMNATPAEKAQLLLDVYPELGAKLNALNATVKALYDERTIIGRDAERKTKYAAELPRHDGLPDAPLSGVEMAQRMRDVLAKNAENDRLRREVQTVRVRHAATQQRVDELRRQLEAATAELTEYAGALARAESAASNLVDEDTTALNAELEAVDATNAKIRANLDKDRAEDEAKQLQAQYHAKTVAIDRARADRLKLLSTVAMPLPDLSIGDDGALIYHGRPWDGMSTMEQLRVGVAICAAINPKCGFVLLDGLERMDVEQLHTFAAWLAERDLQAIGTRVSTGDECSIVIEDGAATEPTMVAPKYKFD